MDKETPAPEVLEIVQAAGERACTPTKSPGNQIDVGEPDAESCGQISDRPIQEGQFSWMAELDIADGVLSVSRRRLMEYLDKAGNTATTFIDELQQHNQFTFTEGNRTLVEKSMKNFKTRIDKKKKEVNYHLERLNVEGDIQFKLEINATAPIKRVGRPKVPYTDASDRVKRARLQQAADATVEIPLQDTLVGYVQRSQMPKRSEMIKIINYCLMSPGRPGHLWNTIEKQKGARSFTVEEALGKLLYRKWTKEDYIEIRDDTRSIGHDIYPPYSKVAQYKENLRPPSETLSVSETNARYPLQSILDHTVTRIVGMTQEVLHRILSNGQPRTFTCFFSWGFDGSTGQSNYKQKFADASLGPHSDSSLFATTVIPLMIVQGDSYQGQVLWMNAVPQSTRFCRPVELEFVKETHAVILSKKESMDQEIASLTAITIEANQEQVQFNYHLAMTVIDGKVLNVVQGNLSSMCCPMCKMNPKSFNDLDNITNGKFNVTPDDLKYGLSPLHAYIRLLEFCLHISYNICFKTWQARGASAKEQVETRKRAIQDKLFHEMGLRVDYPAPGGSGSSNDGNTARRAFENYEQFAEILELDLELIRRFSMILISISLSYPIDGEKFGAYCLETATLYVEKYGWYYMSATLHKILIHGKDIIQSSVLPIGMYSEQAGESKHKEHRQSRLHHTRKSNRVYTMIDTIHRSMDCSDPVLASNSLSKQQFSKKKKQLPADVLALLHVPQEPPTFEKSHEVRRELFDDDEDEEVVAEIRPEDDSIFEGLLHSDEVEIDSFL